MLLWPLYLLDQKHSHIASRGTGLRNVSTQPTLHYLGQEQGTLAAAATPLLPILYWDTSGTSHAWAPMLVCWPEAASQAPSQPAICRGCQAQPTHTVQYPDLTSSSHLPAPPSSSLSSVRFVSFWAGGGEE